MKLLVLGLQHAVEQRSKLKMDIRIDPATIVISEGGVFELQKPTLITELGLLTILSTDKVSDDTYKDVKSERHRELMIKVFFNFLLLDSSLHLNFYNLRRVRFALQERIRELGQFNNFCTRKGFMSLNSSIQIFK